MITISAAAHFSATPRRQIAVPSGMSPRVGRAPSRTSVGESQRLGSVGRPRARTSKSRKRPGQGSSCDPRQEAVGDRATETAGGRAPVDSDRARFHRAGPTSRGRARPRSPRAKARMGKHRRRRSSGTSSSGAPPNQPAGLRDLPSPSASVNRRGRNPNSTSSCDMRLLLSSIWSSTREPEPKRGRPGQLAGASDFKVLLSISRLSGELGVSPA